jgi:hypothetical protein
MARPEDSPIERGAAARRALHRLASLESPVISAAPFRGLHPRCRLFEVGRLKLLSLGVVEDRAQVELVERLHPMRNPLNLFLGLRRERGSAAHRQGYDPERRVASSGVALLAASCLNSLMDSPIWRQ